MEFFIAAALIAALIWQVTPRRSLRPAPIASRRPAARHHGRGI